MPNRAYDRMDDLRREVEALVDANRVRWTRHAKLDHPELSQADKLDIIRWGGRDQPNLVPNPAGPSYVCWASHPDHGVCRGVYAVVETRQGKYLQIITAFRDD